MRRIIALAMALGMTEAAAHADPICPDRPAKATGTCTAPTGRWQLETGLADWLRSDGGNAALLVGASTLKYGVSDRSDVEASMTPYVSVENGGARQSGVGDLSVRFKQRLTRNDTAVQVALVPFVKLPAARRGIGNGKLEGGLIVPVAIPIGGGLTATLGPEVDLLADAGGAGRHAQIVQLVNLGASIAPRLAVAGELWSAWNFDPSGTVRQASADLSVAYAANDDLAFDTGINVRLTRATPDVELYVGVSTRF